MKKKSEENKTYKYTFTKTDKLLQKEIEFLSNLIRKGRRRMKKITLGSLIAEYRQKKNWNQTQLAKKLGISNQYINDIENDRRVPKKIQLISKIAKTLNINEDYLHYINDSFPLQERKEKASIQAFKQAIKAFRATIKKYKS